MKCKHKFTKFDKKKFLEEIRKQELDTLKSVIEELKEIIIILHLFYVVLLLIIGILY